MSTSTLIAHSPKFESRLVSLSTLRALPEPLALGRIHRPVAHAKLVDTILQEIDLRNYKPVREQYALGAKDHALFGVIDLAPKSESLALVPQRGLSFGFRTSTNESLAIKAVAGQRVFVCDNLTLSGDTIALQRKSTTGLDLGDAIARGFDKFLQHAQTLELHIERLVASALTDGQAKQVIYDVFAARVAPVRLLDDVGRFYFKATDEQPDCQSRSLWGLHNAFTRAFKDLTPIRVFGATIALGKVFGLSSRVPKDEAPIIDAESVRVEHDDIEQYI